MRPRLVMIGRPTFPPPRRHANLGMQPSLGAIRWPSSLRHLLRTNFSYLPRQDQRQRLALTAGIIAASGRPWSLKEAMSLLEHVQFVMFPNPKNANYKAWQASADHFDRVYR